MANEFNSPDRMSDFSLKLSYWYVVHKLLIKKILIGAIIAINVGLYGFVFVRLGFILFVEEPAFNRALNELTSPLIDYPTLRERNYPAEIEVAGFDALPSLDDRYDFAAKLSNPNTNHIAIRVTVQLVSNGEVAAEKVVFVYPQQSTYVMFFNQTADPNSAELRIADVDWRRFLNFSAYADPRLRFEISDEEFIPAGSPGLGSRFPASILRFNIKNASAYSYWQVGLQMVLYGGGTISGINYLALEQLRAGETRTVEMRWLQPLPTITDFEIVPEVDILSPSAFMPVN